MLIENRAARILVVSLLVLLVIPLLAMLGMMIFGGGMTTGGMHMGAGLVALCFLWTLLVATALIGLIVLLIRGGVSTRHREISSANLRSPLAH